MASKIDQFCALFKSIQFKVQKDSSGLTYQIKHTFFPNDTTKTDKLTEHWITKIK